MNKSKSRPRDRYEARAREMAMADGIDPNSRMPYGHKTQPAWCTYRDKAKQEASNMEVVVATGIMPQPDQYKDAPLTIFGAHEPNTIEQMKTCMTVGNVVAGVVCADGHLGYAQPVGGVIAYEDQISISGVGFDIGCFTGDTKIFTLKGDHCEIKTLVGEEFCVLASTPEGRPVASRATAVMTRRDASLVAVTLDNGEVIRCTPDQKFMTRDGNYSEASALQVGQSLMPFYSIKDEYGYVLVRNNKLPKKSHLLSLHWIVARSGLMGAFPVYGDDKIIIHHRNYTPSDNDPSNLCFMPQKEHDALHASERNRDHVTPEFEANRISALKSFWEKARLDPVFMAKRAETGRKNLLEAKEAGKMDDNWKTAGQRGRNTLIAYNKSGASANTRKARALISALDNHKVISVVNLLEREDVYCLNVPEHHNFALSAGVYVHNCGNMAVRLDTRYDDVKANVRTIMDDIRKNISFGVGRTNDAKVDNALFDDDEVWKHCGMDDYRKKAYQQLGTVGSGNHYVDLFSDEDGFVWIGVHFGSRGLGHTTATRFLKMAGGRDGINVPPAVVDVGSEVGDRYLAGMNLAGRYAYAGREWVVDRVRQMIGGNVTKSVHNHHNFAWLEEHFGKKLWVVRKGATPAFPGQEGFVGGSMGEDAVIIEGLPGEGGAKSLYSTVHGAGRKHGRKEAKRLFNREAMEAWLQAAGVVLVGGDLDESPMAYKRLPEVLAYHSETIKVNHVLKPFGVAMAGGSDFDPFKD